MEHFSFYSTSEGAVIASTLRVGDAAAENMSCSCQSAHQHLYRCHVCYWSIRLLLPSAGLQAELRCHKYIVIHCMSKDLSLSLHIFILGWGVSTVCISINNTSRLKWKWMICFKFLFWAMFTFSVWPQIYFMFLSCKLRFGCLVLEV